MSDVAFQNTIDQVAEKLSGQPTWWREWQNNHAEHYRQLGLPTSRNEDWKYTPLNKKLPVDFAVLNERTRDVNIQDDDLQGVYRIVLVNGVYCSDKSDVADLPQGLTITSIKQLLHEDPESLHALFKTAHGKDTSMRHLNAALLSDGIVLRVSKGVHVEKPIVIQHVSTQQAVSVMQHIRHHYVLEEQASAIIFEEYCGEHDAQYFNNVIVDMLVSPMATLQHYKLQHESLLASHVAQINIWQGRDSQVDTYHLALGGKLSRDDLNIQLAEQGANCQLLGLYLPSDQQHIDNHSHIHHQVGHTASSQHYRGIASGTSVGVFNGKILIDPQANVTAAHQSNRNLLLSEKATINTKPELEIYADDVQCSHGATVGELDNNALFYLQSRGIDQQTARQLLTRAFIDELLLELPEGNLATYMQKHSHEKLSQHGE